MVRYNDYIFLDTPGIDGTEENQTRFQCFNTTADFLRRKQIAKFKLLYIVGSEDCRLASIKSVLEAFEKSFKIYGIQTTDVLNKRNLTESLIVKS